MSFSNDYKKLFFEYDSCLVCDAKNGLSVEVKFVPNARTKATTGIVYIMLNISFFM